MVQSLVGEGPAGTGRTAFIGRRWRIPPPDLRQELLNLRILVELMHLVGKDLVGADAPLDEPPDPLFISGPVRMRVKRPRSEPPFIFQQLHYEKRILQIGTTKPKILVKAQEAM